MLRIDPGNRNAMVIIYWGSDPWNHKCNGYNHLRDQSLKYTIIIGKFVKGISMLNYLQPFEYFKISKFWKIQSSSSSSMSLKTLLFIFKEINI